jgi:hypothetical protein
MGETARQIAAFRTGAQVSGTGAGEPGRRKKIHHQGTKTRRHEEKAGMRAKRRAEERASFLSCAAFAAHSCSSWCLGVLVVSLAFFLPFFSPPPRLL